MGVFVWVLVLFWFFLGGVWLVSLLFGWFWKVFVEVFLCVLRLGLLFPPSPSQNSFPLLLNALLAVCLLLNVEPTFWKLSHSEIPFQDKNNQLRGYHCRWKSGKNKVSFPHVYHICVHWCSPEFYHLVFHYWDLPGSHLNWIWSLLSSVELSTHLQADVRAVSSWISES